MNELLCGDVSDRLAAFRDNELSMADQVAVRAHLCTCGECAAELDALEWIGHAVRLTSHARVERYADDVASVHNRVMAGLPSYRAEPLPQRVLRWTDDLHRVWTLVGATVASVVCLFAGLGVMRSTLREAPTSMAAVIGAMGDPGSDRNPMRVDGRMLLPTLDNAIPAIVVSPDEAMLALSAIVTREGRVSRVELVMPEATRLPHEDAVLELLDAAAQTRFEPARAGGLPVAVNVIWLMAHTTVVGKNGLESLPGTRPVRRLQQPAPPRQVAPAAAPLSKSALPGIVSV